MIKEEKMPKNSKVHDCYINLIKQGKSKKEAAKICQQKTDQALQTGQPPRGGRAGNPKTDAERRKTHQAKYGTTKLPKRGTGRRTLAGRI